MSKVWVHDIDTARELLGYCGYPVYEAKWVTHGGGSLRDFQTDEEVIEFAQKMQTCIDKRIEEMCGSESNFEDIMRKIGWLEDD